MPNEQKALLEAARSASAATNVLQNHSKPDNPTWRYRGRYYGVGSGQGLREAANISAEYNLLGYMYNETGYKANVNCIRNTSAALALNKASQVENADVLYIQGRLPKSQNDEYYPVIN